MISYRKISKRFGPKVIFDELDFEIKKGEVVFLIGQSGVGKSVLLKSTVGLMPLDSGEIWLDGARIDGQPESEWVKVRRHCGMVFQQPALFDSLNIFENVAFGIRRHLKVDELEVRDRVRYALSMVGLSGIEDKTTHSISYGMQKRVSLARTLALEPKVLLFDEPTTGLDPATTIEINDLIVGLSRNLKATALVVSHDIVCAVKSADTIALISQGRFVFYGPASDIRSSDHSLVQSFLEDVI